MAKKIETFKIKSSDRGISQLLISQEELNQMIQKKAYELYEKRGRQHGHDLEDWAKAEKIVKESLSR